MDHVGAGEGLGVAALHLHLHLHLLLLVSIDETTYLDIMIVVVQAGRPRFNELLESFFYWEES